MREIKFRAWDKTNKQMLLDKDLWIHIYPQKNIKETSVANFPDYHIGEQPNDISYDPRTDLEIMQYTGLKDKNGVEIYEGDIMGLMSFPYSEIVFQGGKFTPVYGDGSYDEWELDFGGFADESLVLGNIYENPELLK